MVLIMRMAPWGAVWRSGGYKSRYRGMCSSIWADWPDRVGLGDQTDRLSVHRGWMARLPPIKR